MVKAKRRANPDTLYQPKGGMCYACQHMQRDCSGLPFHTMPGISSFPGSIVVRCTEFSARGVMPTLPAAPPAA